MALLLVASRDARPVLAACGTQASLATGIRIGLGLLVCGLHKEGAGGRSVAGRRAEGRREHFVTIVPFYMPTIGTVSNYCTTGCVVEEFCGMQGLVVLWSLHTPLWSQDSTSV